MKTLPEYDLHARGMRVDELSFATVAPKLKGRNVLLAKDIAEFMLKCLRLGQKSVRFDSGRCWAETLSSGNMVK